MIDHMPGSVYKVVIICGVSLMCFIPVLFYNKQTLTEKGSIFFTVDDDDFSFNSRQFFISSDSCK